MPRRNSFLKVGIFLFGIAVAFFLLWKGPQWQVSHYQGLDSKAWFAQVNEARKTLAQILGGAFVLFGLYLSLETFILSREGQITDRFSKAVEMLGTPGDDKLEVRLGGIYALERIARDSKRDHSVVMEVLTAYVREHARETSTPPKRYDRKTRRLVARADESGISTDIQSILTVICRRETKYDGEAALDLRRTNLRTANLTKARLEWAQLQEAHLEGATLWHARLEGANLWEAHLEGAVLIKADLKRAILIGAHLDKADLEGAHLEEATFFGAKLEGAQLHDANLERAILINAHLGGAYLLGARLDGARLSGAHLGQANLEGADLEGADLHYSDLSEARFLMQEQIDSAWGNKDTKLPPDLKMPESWL